MNKNFNNISLAFKLTSYQITQPSSYDQESSDSKFDNSARVDRTHNRPTPPKIADSEATSQFSSSSETKRNLCGMLNIYQVTASGVIVKKEDVIEDPVLIDICTLQHFDFEKFSEQYAQYCRPVLDLRNKYQGLLQEQLIKNNDLQNRIASYCSAYPKKSHNLQSTSKKLKEIQKYMEKDIEFLDIMARDINEHTFPGFGKVPIEQACEKMEGDIKSLLNDQEQCLIKLKKSLPMFPWE